MVTHAYRCSVPGLMMDQGALTVQSEWVPGLIHQSCRGVIQRKLFCHFFVKHDFGERGSPAQDQRDFQKNLYRLVLLQREKMGAR